MSEQVRFQKYLFSLYIESVQYQDRVEFNRNNGNVYVTHTWFKNWRVRSRRYY